MTSVTSAIVLAAGSSHAAAAVHSAAGAASSAAPRVWIPATEAHAMGDDVHVVLSSAGHAEIAHQLHWQVISGAMHTFDLVGVEESATLRPEIAITGDDGTRWTAHASWFAPRVVRVATDDSHGLKKGSYHFDLRYDVELPAARELVRDGAMWRLAWTAPNAIEGFDAARVVFDLPAAPTAPRADMGGETGEDGIVATVQRGAARDTLELVRPHVGRGESVTWAVRLDPRALAALSATREARENAANATMATGELPVIGRWRRALAALAIGTFALLYARGVTKRKGRSLVPASPKARAALSALALAAGLGLHLVGRASLGAPFLAAAMLLATVRAATSDASGKARGPGAWSALPVSAVFGARGAAEAIGVAASSARARFVAPFRGLAAFCLVGLAAVAVRLAAADSPSLALAAIDALVLLPLLLGGGTEASAVERARPRLARVFRRLAKNEELLVVPWARTPVGRSTVDELRLRVEPRAPMPGAGGVELGFALDASGASSPEVLVRVQTTSCASARIAALAPWAASVPGRTPEERVVRLSPRWPSVRLAEKLTARMALALVDRRDDAAKSPSGSRPSRFSGRDRRGAPADSAPPAAVLPSFGGLDAAADASLLLLR